MKFVLVFFFFSFSDMNVKHFPPSKRWLSHVGNNRRVSQDVLLKRLETNCAAPKNILGKRANVNEGQRHFLWPLWKCVNSIVKMYTPHEYVIGGSQKCMLVCTNHRMVYFSLFMTIRLNDLLYFECLYNYLYLNIKF